MKIIVGLGNPGPKYELTRHNLGFLAVDQMIDRWGATGPLKKMNGEIYELNRQNECASCPPIAEKVLLVKPKTFMNLSGNCVAPIVHFYKVEPADLIVLHDELDLPKWTIRIKTGGGPGGHNGIKSIDQSLGAERTGYHRIRLGLGRPSDPVNGGLAMESSNFVLTTMSDEELREFEKFLEPVLKAAKMVVEGKVEQAMTEFNRRKN